MKRLLRKLLGIGPAFVLAALIASPVFAATYSYYVPITVSDSSGSAKTGIPIVVDLNNSGLASLDYMESSGLDTALQEAGTDRPYSVVDKRLGLLLPSLAAYQAKQLMYYTTYSPAQTSFDFIGGPDSYITVSDAGAAALELGNNFEIEQKGWIDTAAGSDKNLVYKEDAFRTYISGATDITAEITITSEKKDEIIGSGASTYTIYDDKWSSMPITASSSYSIYKVVLKSSKKVLSPGDLICEIYNTTDHKPTGSALGSGTVAEGSLPTDYADIPIILDSPVAIGNGVEYAVVYRTTTGDISNYVQTSKMGTSNDFHSISEDNGESWDYTGTGNYGIDQEVWSAPMLDVVATGISSGVRRVVVTATGGGTNLLTISVYDENNDLIDDDSVALAGASVPDNSNDWTLMQTNVMPSLEFYKHTVSSTLIAWYEPVIMISGTTLPDRQGAAQNGTITWAGRLVDSGSTTTLVDDALTQADDYWNGYVLRVKDTTDDLAPKGEESDITNFDAGTDTLTFDALTVAVGDGDRYEIWDGQTILWGSFPEGIKVEVGALSALSSAESAAAGGVDPTVVGIPPLPSGAWGGAADPGLPLYPLFSRVATDLGWTAQTLYVTASVIVAVGMGVAALLMTGSILAAIVMASIGMGGGYAMGVLPLWMLMVYGLLGGTWMYVARSM